VRFEDGLGEGGLADLTWAKENECLAFEQGRFELPSDLTLN